MEMSLRQYLDERAEINSLGGPDSDDLPERLHSTAQRMREARARTYPPLSPEQIATLASLLGMRVRLPDVQAETQLVEDVQAETRAQLVEDARARLRQAERAGDWQAQLDAWLELDRLGQ